MRFCWELKYCFSLFLAPGIVFFKFYAKILEYVREKVFYNNIGNVDFSFRAFRPKP